MFPDGRGSRDLSARELKHRDPFCLLHGICQISTTTATFLISGFSSHVFALPFFLGLHGVQREPASFTLPMQSRGGVGGSHIVASCEGTGGDLAGRPPRACGPEAEDAAAPAPQVGFAHRFLLTRHPGARVCTCDAEGRLATFAVRLRRPCDSSCDAALEVLCPLPFFAQVTREEVCVVGHSR